MDDFKPFHSDFFPSSALPEELIHINSCGELRLDTESHMVRPSGRQDYLLIYIESGRCYVTEEGITQEAVAGDVIFYRPNEPQDYDYRDEDCPQTNFWFHFTGGYCEKLIEDVGLTRARIVHLKNPNRLEMFFTSICENYHMAQPNFALACAGQLISVLAVVGRDAAELTENFDESSSMRLMSQLIAHMKMVNQLSMRIENAAKFCNMSTTHFNRTFKQLTGVSPKEFMTRRRIDRAKELLLFTDRSIANIAELVGYKDQNYFARVFRQITGVSPTHFKKSVHRTEPPAPAAERSTGDAG